MKRYLLFLFIMFYGSLSYASAQDPIKLYVFFTPSHKIFYDEWFLPSLQDDYEIITECYDQECSSGVYMKEGWMKTMEHKVDLVICGVQENWGKVFIHSDVDIQFFGKTEEIILREMRDKDLMIQRDNPGGVACAGFFACRGNERTLKLWQDVKKYMKEHPGKHDQASLNILIRALHRYLAIRGPRAVRWGYLPKESFFGGGTFTGRRWLPGRRLPVPKKPLMHHANYCVGVSQKIAQLQYVKKVVKNRKR